MSLGAAQFEHLPKPAREPVSVVIDGQVVEAAVGDTILTAVLRTRRHLRTFEFRDEPRSGFCLMGACQDCWVSLGGGARVRACSTLVTAGVVIVTAADRKVEGGRG